MTYLNSPMTKLAAVNICLSAMGEPVINSLEAPATDAQMCSDIVDEVTRSVQSICWHWNNEKHTFSPDTDGFIKLPGNTLRVDSIDASRDVDVIQRGLRLFDRGTNSYVFTIPLTVDLYVCLEYEDMPFAAKQYVTARAARTTQQRLLGSDTLYKFDTADETKAFAVLMQEEAESMDANVLYDSNSTSMMLVRSSAFYRGPFR